jgi:nitrogen fixation/metabolism regulation signal transduction histidine kinase
MRSFQADDPKAKEKITRVAQSMIEQIDALTNIANEFAHFAKMPPPKMETIDLIPILENVVEVNHIDACAFELNFSNSKALILGDKEQMLRTFNNLIKNAIQAIPSEKQGQIIIRIAQESSKIIVEIEDNGIGIVPEEQAKLFVPYFTTKSNGTGLGLAMVKQIVENHAGTISFKTTPKTGTIFTISLPII